MDSLDVSEIESQYRRVREARTPKDQAEAIDRLLASLRPTVARIVDRRIGHGAYAAQHGRRALEEQMKDLVQDALLKVSLRLTDQTAPALENAESYAVKTTQSVCNEFYRVLFPRRYAAQKRVLSHLNHNPHFYGWSFPAGKHGALSRWPTPPPVAEDTKVSRILEDARGAATEITGKSPIPPGDLVQRRSSDGHNTADSMWITLYWCSGALKVDFLVKAVQAIENDFDEAVKEEILEGQTSQATQEANLSQSALLSAIWAQIQTLDRRQATSILLGPLFKGVGVEAFIASNAAKVDEIASMAGFEPEDFDKRVMAELPWPDSEISRHLGATVQGVRTWRWEGMAKIVKGLKEDGHG